MICAFSLVRSMRTVSVLVPRRISQESIGPRIAPAAFCTNFIQSTSSWCLRMTTPPTLSLWPLRNFVVLCRTMSAPERQRPLDVRARKGVVDDDRTFLRWAIALTHWMSVMCSIGLVGVSMNRYFVFGLIAGSTSSGFDVST